MKRYKSGMRENAVKVMMVQELLELKKTSSKIFNVYYMEIEPSEEKSL